MNNIRIIKDKTSWISWHVKGSVKTVVKVGEITDVLCVRTIKKMLCYSTCDELNRVFIKAALKTAFSFTYVFLVASWK